MLDLDRRGRDIRCFVDAMEGWLIETLARFGVSSFKAPGRVGVWTRLPDGREAKIAAIGVRVRRWVSYHGFALNVAPDLSHFGGIVPCGLPDFPVTSLAALGIDAGLSDADAALAASLPHLLERLR
jgi:lipoyl(octanoyl) transferase